MNKRDALNSFTLVAAATIFAMLISLESQIGATFGLGLLGFATLGTFFLFLIDLTSGAALFRPIVHFVWPLSALSLIYFFGGIEYEEIGASSLRIFQIVVIFAVLSFFYKRGKEDSAHLAAYKMICAFGVGGFSLWMIGCTLSNVESGFVNDNAVGIWLAVVFMIGASQFSSRWGLFVFSILTFIGIYFSGSRAAAGALVGGLLVFLFWPLIIKKRWAFASVLILILVAAWLIIFALAGSFAMLDAANEVAKGAAQKNLLSGRDLLWPQILELSRERIWLGWGAGTQLPSIGDHGLSAHNAYLQILFQAGSIGLFAFGVSLILLWNQIWMSRFKTDLRIATCAFVVLLLTQNFEVTILQNNLALSLPVWAFLGLSLGQADIREIS